jgi:hypothetical protein
MTNGFRTRLLASSNSHFALARWPLPPVRQIYGDVTARGAVGGGRRTSQEGHPRRGTPDRS